jgi:hypothetical protein
MNAQVPAMPSCSRLLFLVFSAPFITKFFQYLHSRPGLRQGIKKSPLALDLCLFHLDMRRLHTLGLLRRYIGAMESDILETLRIYKGE